MEHHHSQRKQWPWLLAACGLGALALVGIGDQYPFSHFPMYATVEPSVDVLYLTDQSDTPLPMSSLFDVGSAQGKKRFEKELYAEAKTRDYENATPEQVKKAAERFLTALWKDRREKKVAALGVERLRARVITVTVDDDKGFKREEHLLGEIDVANLKGAP